MEPTATTPDFREAAATATTTTLRERLLGAATGAVMTLGTLFGVSSAAAQTLSPHAARLQAQCEAANDRLLRTPGDRGAQTAARQICSQAQTAARSSGGGRQSNLADQKERAALNRELAQQRACDNWARRQQFSGGPSLRLGPNGVTLGGSVNIRPQLPPPGCG